MLRVYAENDGITTTRYICEGLDGYRHESLEELAERIIAAYKAAGTNHERRGELTTLKCAEVEDKMMYRDRKVVRVRPLNGAEREELHAELIRAFATVT